MVATNDIPKMTLICEYVGDVYPLRMMLLHNNDSVMELLKAPSSKRSLVIAPETHCNLARFISGINNADPTKARKQNTKSVKYSVNGQARIFLYTCKRVRKGELLYYDYHGGGYDNYPTQDFV